MRNTAAERLFDDLIERCYACVLDSSAWYALLQRLLSASGRQSVGLLFWDQRQGGPRVGSISMFSPATIQAYNEHFHAFDPSRQFMLGRKPGDWYHDVEELGEERMRRDPFYAEFRQLEGLQRISCLKLYETDRAGAYLSLLALTGAAAPRKEHQQLLVRMAPHLERAGRLSQHIHELELDVARRDLLLDRHDSPIWLVDADGRVRYANHAAERWLGSSHCPLCLREGRLLGRDQPARLAALIRIAAGPAPARAGWLQAAQPSAYELLITPFSAENTALPEAGRRLALVVSPRRVFHSALLADLFHLTHAECRVAGQLAGGATPEQCALALGVTIHTVRTQLRALFRKTGTERQAELVVLLSRLGAC
ncbi:hypothetical protein ASG87_01255 [Frateuria sp. Soil773]|uniref:helix-turn-helix transcriptional regulator n=1 Tax=Frateuria sp. Soil773 TaxID=1736407 RepID=UPI0006FA4772|nr:PAS domain-containing protein [Frateuria sp. Soil773]KRE90791.1 hypothetical protein ASG87_01255 [Frateuria sp. Soil773]